MSITQTQSPYVALAAEQMGTSYTEARTIMRDLRDRHGMTYREFAQRRLFRYRSARARERAVARWLEREETYVQQVMHETGWSHDEAERRMRAAKEKWPSVTFRHFASYRFASVGEEQIAAKVEEWKRSAESYRQQAVEASGWSMDQVRAHMTRCQILFDIIPAYYVCYRCWELSDEQIDGYARQALSQRISAKRNDRADMAVLAQKDQFDREYADLVRRKFWVNEQSSSFAEFLAFAEGLDEAFCKPLASGGGIGTFVVDLAGSEDDLRALYERFMDQPLVLVEEKVAQHDAINAFYPRSVNTVRVVTLQDDEGIHLISAGIRFGQNGIVDNFSADGMVADVDIDSGRIVTAAVDKKGRVHETHPYSGKAFVGFEVPRWSEILETARAAMDVLPGINYVGWDVAIGPDRVSLIEGNSQPDLVLVQAPYAPAKVGKRYLFEKWLDEKPLPTASKSKPEDEERSGSFLSRVAKKARKIVAPPSRIERDGVVYRIGARGATVTGTTGDLPAVLTIPEKIEDSPVTAIAASAFARCEALTQIELPESITVLEDRVFAGATSLTSVGLPYALTRIGAECFAGCSSLTELYYYSQRGISDVMVTDRTLRSDALPTLLETIGAGAFRDCTALTRVEIPYLVRAIPARAFAGCAALTHVGLHNRLRSIGAGAFRGCEALASLRVPFGCREFGEGAFAPETTLVVSKTSAAATHAEETGQPWRSPSKRGGRLNSVLVPGSEYERFYTDEQLMATVERHETRTPSYLVRERADEGEPGEIPASRFVAEENGYRGQARTAGQARIMIVGDLMARFRQQRNAHRRDPESFDFSFDHVRDLFSQADFVAGNLESMVSPSAPYTREMEHVDARPHLNAPFSFLAAVRRAGIDCVTHAQNHVYDAGTRGVFETLDAANRAQLLHTGAFASAHDRRFVVVDIDGIRVGLLAYLDSARQMMKKANYTKTGLGIMFPYFDAERVAKDVADARAAGAEFVIANCHWGREYTPEVTERQRGFAQLVANAGVDYIVGAHSHCLQPYEVLTSSDGRRVPCVWSAGNFISDINLKPPITRDTLVMDLVLQRDEVGHVTLANESYHPCRIMSLRDGDDRDYAVVPTSTDLGGAELNAALAEARERIVAVVGDGIAAAT